MKVYAAKHKDSNVVENSRSGGVFTALSDVYIEHGVVYGCVMNSLLEAVHVRANTHADRDKMRGSKYVQSNLGTCFRQVKNDLETGLHVMFTGTSCQIAGLKAFLRKSYSNLICVDIVCHGVPSPLVWRSYLNFLGHVDSVEFRDKKQFGWRAHVETFSIEGEKKYSRIWSELFYSGNILRPVCYECPYKSIFHPGDITIADYWGIEKVVPEFDDNRGVSLVLINNEKGEYLFERVKDNLLYKETKIEDSMQRAFIEPEKRPPNRDIFWKDFHSHGFAYIRDKYCLNESIIRRMVGKFKRYLLSFYRRTE